MILIGLGGSGPRGRPYSQSTPGHDQKEGTERLMSTQDAPVSPGQPTDPPASPPAPAPPAPAPPAPAPPAPSASAGAQRAGQELLEAIQALPERIIAGLRETTPKQPVKRAEIVAKTETGGTPPPSTQKVAAEPGEAPAGMSKLAKWWFS